MITWGTYKTESEARSVIARSGYAPGRLTAHRRGALGAQAGLRAAPGVPGRACAGGCAVNRNDSVLPTTTAPLPLPVSEPQVLQPMPPDMLPGGMPTLPPPWLQIDQTNALGLMLRQCLRNQWLLLQLAVVSSPTGGLLKGQVEAALNATEDLLGGKP